MISQESIKCPVCLTPFDANKCIPKILPICGHTVCEECLIQVLRMGTPKCPLDKLSFGRDFRSIDSFPTNFLGKHLLEWNGKWRRCSTHPQEISKVICLTDQTLICSDCAIFGDHQGHEIKSLSEVQNLANLKKNQLSEILNQIFINVSKFEKSISGKEQTIKEIIKERFQLLYEIIKKQETQMLLKLDKMLEQEIAAMKIPLLDDKASEIKKKLQEFPQILTNPNLLIKALEEDFTELEETVADELTLTSQKMEEFTSLLDTFEKSLPKEDLLKDLNTTDALDKNLAEFHEKRKFSLEVLIPPGLSFEFENDRRLEVQKGGNSQTK